jgi:hypothetical protein
LRKVVDEKVFIHRAASIQACMACMCRCVRLCVCVFFVWHACVDVHVRVCLD